MIGHIQYVRWQDGAFLKSKGFPLLPLLALLGNKDALHTISRPDSQLSHVLPLTPTGFSDLMNRFMRQSNMVARPPKPPSWTTTKIADEGSSSPFMARMYLGVLGLRDQVIPSGVERDGFDKASSSQIAHNVIALKHQAQDNQANPDFALANGNYRLDVGDEAYYASASG